jgi:glycosyltransferase involved in cell wall biosynthesis
MAQYPDDPRVRREAEALAEAGVWVDVICLRGPEESATETIGSVRTLRILHASDKETINRYLLLSLQFLVLSFLKILRLSARKRYDLIQFHNMPDYLVLAGILHKLMGTSLILDLHDLSVDLFDSKWGRARSRCFLPIVRLVERFSCALANSLITPSQGCIERLVARGISVQKITLVMNSAVPEVFKKTLRDYRQIDDGARLIYHGTVAHRFGVHVAIEAMSLIKRRIPGSTLHVYGLRYDPGYRAFLEERVKLSGLEDCVFLEGFRPWEEIARIICQSDLAVVPYLRDPYMELALSTKTFECVAMGLPVVSARLKSLTSIFDEECLTYFEPGNAAEMAHLIIELSGNPQLRKERAERALLAYQPVSWPVMKDRYVNLALNLMHGRG